ncbi:MAG TPA: nicotinate-nucleotide adenylyltransferase [Candidatus Limnocylindrales bacterium]
MGGALSAPRPVAPGSLGVLGGTFDPVHLGHLALAEEAREALGLERVMFVPAAVPPHKQGIPMTAAADRAAMVELAIADNPAFGTSRIELERTGPSYTVDTLEAIHDTGVDLWLILSAETYREFDTWRRPERILELARVAVAPRDGYELPGGAGAGSTAARVTFLDGPRLRVSASEIRGRVAAGRSIRYLVPPAVRRYIADHDLYRATTDPATKPSDAGIMEDNVTRTSAS